MKVPLPVLNRREEYRMNIHKNAPLASLAMIIVVVILAGCQ